MPLPSDRPDGARAVNVVVCHDGRATGAEVIASAASAAEMEQLPPSTLGMMTSLDLGDATNRYIAMAFGPFTFDDIEPPYPDRTFSGALDLEVGGQAVELIEVGPAHTAGDVIVPGHGPLADAEAVRDTAVYREIDPAHDSPGALPLFTLMAEIAAAHP